MKKRFVTLALILTLILAPCLVACGGQGGGKKGAELEHTAYTYTVSSDAGVTVGISFGDSAFVKLKKGDADVAPSDYVLSGSLLLLKNSYLDTLGGGEHTFTVVTDVNEVNFTVTVSASRGVGIDDLIDGSYYQTELGSGNGLSDLPADAQNAPDYAKYLALKEANKPLAAGESFTVNYGTDAFEEMRLRPYNKRLLPSSAGEGASTAFKYVEENGKTGLAIKSTGADYPSRSDELQLKGSSFVNGATYSLSVEFRAVTAGAAYSISFHGARSLSLAYTDGKMVATASATFTVPPDLYITGDHNWYYNCLNITISCDQPAELIIYSLTLTRTA